MQAELITAKDESPNGTFDLMAAMRAENASDFIPITLFGKEFLCGPTTTLEAVELAEIAEKLADDYIKGREFSRKPTESQISQLESMNFDDEKVKGYTGRRAAHVYYSSKTLMIFKVAAAVRMLDGTPYWKTKPDEIEFLKGFSETVFNNKSARAEIKRVNDILTANEGDDDEGNENTPD